jgi:predicted nucleic acid-binding protein
MIVVDTSVVVDALVVRPLNHRVAERLLGAGDLCAPHLIDTEFLSVLRNLARAGVLNSVTAAAARADFERLSILRFDHLPLSDRVWQLRDNATAYDATFVALAEILDVPLVTCDERLAKVPGLRTSVEVIPPV